MTQHTVSQSREDLWAPYEAQKAQTEQAWQNYERLSDVADRAWARRCTAFEAYCEQRQRQDELFDDAYDAVCGGRPIADARHAAGLSSG